jgi:hypothetical protein
MSTGTVNTVNTKIDQTVRIFDQFYKYEATIPQMEYDAIYSYFRSVFATSEQAGNFTTVMFRIAEDSGIPAMTLFEEIRGQGLPELNLTLAYYLNTLRSSTTLLGINAKNTPNYYVARNIRA